MHANDKFKAKGIHWDLSDLYMNIDDPRIVQDKQEIWSMVKNLELEYRDALSSPELSAEKLYDGLVLYEKILIITSKICDYSALVYSIDTKDSKIGKLYQEALELESNVSSSLMFFELGIVNIDESHFDRLIKNKNLREYLVYLEKIRKNKPFTLSEKEEVILSKKSQTSSQALVRFFDQFDSSVRYQVDIEGKNLSLSYSEIIPHLTAEYNRNIRVSAAKAMSEALEKHSDTYSFILNTLLADKMINDELRGYSTPQQATFIHYQVEPEIVESMSREIENGYSLAEKYYFAKKNILNIDVLDESDRYVLPYKIDKFKYTWDEAVELVLKSFDKFSPEFGDIAGKFIDNKWIHAEILPNKRSGAYCSYTIPSNHPYILVNFSGEIRDVTTLAHELGHGIHGYLSRNNKFLQFWPSTSIAEIASIFAESLVFDEIYRNVKDKKVKANLLAEKIQSIFASIFRQNAFYLFESDIHIHRRVKGELSVEEFNNYFQSRMQAMFGMGLTLSGGHANWWMSIMHFYHYNFYVFSYAFGEMLSLSLYAKYKSDGQKMIDDYSKALRTGGTKTPQEVTKMMGVDITDPDFWKNGLKLIDNYINEFLELSK